MPTSGPEMPVTLTDPVAFFCAVSTMAMVSPPIGAATCAALAAADDSNSAAEASKIERKFIVKLPVFLLKIIFGTCIQMPHLKVEQLCKGIDMIGNRTTASLQVPALLDREREAQLAAALARCAAGDRTALRVIYDSEAPRMVGIARRILFRQDLAEEAVHDAFIRIWRGAAGFDPRRGSARGWPYAVVPKRALRLPRGEHRYEASDENVRDVD